MDIASKKDAQKANLYIDSCGYQILNESGRKMNTYSWSDYHILYVVEGSGYITLDGKHFKLTAGSTAIFHPWDHRDYGFHRTCESKFYYIHFNGAACRRIMNDLGLEGNKLFDIGISISLTKLLDDLINEFRLKNEHYEYMCQSYILSILTLISRKLSDAPRGSSEAKKRINEICRYMKIAADCNPLPSWHSWRTSAKADSRISFHRRWESALKAIFCAQRSICQRSFLPTPTCP